MTIIKLSEDDAKHMSRVRALIDEVSRRDSEWQGAIFDILLGESTCVVSTSPAAPSLLAAIRKLVSQGESSEGTLLHPSGMQKHLC